MTRLRLKILLATLLVIFVLPLHVVLAETSSFNLSTPMINPDSLYYPLKRVWEKAREKLIFSEDTRINYSEGLSRERLAELKFVVENKVLSEVEHSSQRFAFQAGVLTEKILMQNKKAKKDGIVKEFENYSRLLGQLRDKYQANSSFWMLIQHDINTLELLSDKLK